MQEVPYEDMLPKLHVPPRDALEAIAEKIPWFKRNGLFQIHAFVKIFSQRLQEILDHLHNDPQKMEAEKDIAYILRDLHAEGGIDITFDRRHPDVRWLELYLSQKWILDVYNRFAHEQNPEGLEFDDEYFPQYLDYLYFSSWQGIDDALLYLKTCIKISQVYGGSQVLFLHLRWLFIRIPESWIEGFLETHEYTRRSEWKRDMCITPENEEIIDGIEQSRYDAASFHSLLADFYNQFVLPYFDTIPEHKKITATNLLNDFRDIFDPKGYIPLYFHNGNWHETLMRDRKLEEEGKLH
jgi:hypothetical protein